MKKIALIITLCLIATLAYAQDKPASPEKFDFPGGKYYFVQDNGLVIEPNRPMMTDRFASYGDIVLDPKTGQRTPNRKTKDKVTAEGLEIYDLLDRMKAENGFFVFQAVVLRYDTVTLLKYTRNNWDDHINQILNAFAE